MKPPRRTRPSTTGATTPLTSMVGTAAAALPLTGVLLAGLATPASAMPPGIPAPQQARSELAQLAVAPDGPMDGYDRSKFPHWDEGPGGCNTRESVLKRDGQNVRTGSDCYPTSGTWVSPYDGQRWTKASQLDIDHVVPLADAWRTGAAKWTQQQREAFANDLNSPQLVAVTHTVNEAKGDQSPDRWMPPKKDFACTYASMWIASKSKYKLTVTAPEKQALGNALGTCG